MVGKIPMEMGNYWGPIKTSRHVILGLKLELQDIGQFLVNKVKGKLKY